MATTEYKKLSSIFIIIQLILYAAMISGYKGVAYYISIGAVLMFFVGVLATNEGRIPISKSWNSFMLFMAFYTITSMMNFDRGNFSVYAAYYILAFSPILIFEYLRRTSIVTITKSLEAFMYVFLCFCIIAIGYYISNPRLARDMAAHMVEERLAIGGGYSLAYASAILGVYFFTKMLNGRIEKKLKYIIICVICVLLVYLTESAITTMVMMIGFVIAIVLKGRETSRNMEEDLVKFAAIGMVSIVVISLIIYNKYVIAEWFLNLIDGIDNNILYSRIEEIINSFVYGKTSGHYEKRNGTLLASIEVFKEYPIFGKGYQYGNVFSLGQYYGIGDHSEILDALARYGIVGGFLWLYPYFKTIKQIFRKNLGTAITILLLMYFNPFMSFHSNAVVFMFIPLFEEILRRKEQEKAENEIEVN